MTNKLPKIKLVSVGKPKGPWTDLCDVYLKRLERLDSVIIKEIGDGQQDTRIRTSAEILKKIDDNDYVILFDETGIPKSSQQYAGVLEGLHGKNVVLVIGSSYGVDETLKQRSNMILSLSEMVLPHELARVMVLEQTYRAAAILSSHPYHHQ
ncbi:MAG: 23S rRNA (pseudouridine(1915)-N(3))-methyltransferase RlmH [Patescibacteria group bacterium]